MPNYFSTTNDTGTNASTANVRWATSGSSVWPFWVVAASTAMTWNSWSGGTLQQARDSIRQQQSCWRLSHTPQIEITRQHQQPPIETAEQVQARLQRAEQQRQEWAERQARAVLDRAAAEARADALLCNYLTDVQKKQLELFNRFDVVGKSGTTYRINRGRSANVDVLGADGKVAYALCAHPSIGCPDGDTMLSQLLSIRHEEEAFLRLANRHPRDHMFRRQQPSYPHFRQEHALA